MHKLLVLIDFTNDKKSLKEGDIVTEKEVVKHFGKDILDHYLEKGVLVQVTEEEGEPEE